MKSVAITTVILSLVASVFFSIISTPKASALTDLQNGAISQNCASIQNSLKSLQKADSRTRVLLGSTYQTIFTNFITPLNLRLVRHSQPNSDLIEIQSDFIESRTKFSKNFIKYSQSLEQLISIDCKNEPEKFYQTLDQTRKLRAKVQNSVQQIHQLLSRHLSVVKTLLTESSKWVVAPVIFSFSVQHPSL